MKNKVLAIMLATIITICSSMPVFATPDNSQLNDSRQIYAEIENKIIDIQNKVYDLNTQIEPLQLEVDNNQKEIDNINNIADNIKNGIEQYREEINELDLELGQRVKAMYVSGNLEFNYLKFLLESESTTDLFSRAEAVSKIVGKDKLAIKNIDDKKAELNLKIKSLENKKITIKDLNKQVKNTLSELDSKKSAQEILINEANEEKSKFDSEYLSQLEKNAVKTQFQVIDNDNSFSTEIEAGMTQLIIMRDNQIKSPIVIKEINEEIEKAKVLAANKKEKEVKEGLDNVNSRRLKLGSSVSAPAAGKAQAILNEAYGQLGKPYVWGATGPDTFDCSGFTSYVYKHAEGIDITRTTYTQINVGQSVSRDELQPGDLVFPHAGHVGIYVGNGQMINAPETGDVVKVGPIYSFYAARRII